LSIVPKGEVSTLKNLMKKMLAFGYLDKFDIMLENWVENL